MIKLKDLLFEDGDQNNNGYPDGSETNSNQPIGKMHDPRGSEVKVGRYLIHKSMPENRDGILRNGLVAKTGERYQIDNGTNHKNRHPAIFATNSENEKDWFGEDWDEDVWRIDSSLIPNVKWYKDKMFSFTRSGFPFPFLYKHVVTLDNIPPNALELVYKGTGKLKISNS
jgi:hypothetical protein